jgi:signal transduction histidine kinase
MNTKDKHLNILVIEDSPADFYLIQEMLRSSPVNVRDIYSSARISEACSLLQDLEIGLVLLDLSLPDSFGIDSFLRIKPLVQHIPVIILSGLSESTLAIEALQQGAQDYLVKGEFKTDLLTRAINYSIERKNEQLIKQRQITEAVFDAREKERKSICEELHDNINQILATSKLYLSTVLNQKELNKDLISRSEEHISRAMEEIRRLSKSLSLPVFTGGGLKQSIEELIDNILCVKKISFTTDIDALDQVILSESLKINIYRIIQEHLNNILKHAEASDVKVRVTVTEGVLSLSIQDDGKGFDTSLRRKGIGITNINSRAELFNGKVELDSSPGEGCILNVELSMKLVKAQKAA